MRARRFTDAFRILNPEANGFTFPAPDPNARLDYFFVNGALCPTLRQCEVVVSPANVRSASDHLPLRLELEL
jgi:endonuclease/exonuclease/phosphatase family metal-dependent hydrolase